MKFRLFLPAVVAAASIFFAGCAPTGMQSGAVPEGAGAKSGEKLRCSQRLGEVLAPRWPERERLVELHSARLDEAGRLLAEGLAPCDSERQPRWWKASAGLLEVANYMRDWPEIEPVVTRSAALFRQHLLMRLTTGELTTHLADAPYAETVIRALVHLPDADAVAGLEQLRSAGVLALTYGKTGKLASKALNDLADKEVSQTVFDIIVAASAEQHVRGTDLLFSAIARKSAVALRRALALNPLPLDTGYEVLVRAAQDPETLAILLEAALRPGADGRPVQLPAGEVDPLIRKVLTKGDPVDWATVDRLLRHGGDLTRAFEADDGRGDDNIAWFITGRLPHFKAAVERGLRLDVRYAHGARPLPPVFIMLGYTDMRRAHPKERERANEAIRFMLSRHNNVNQREQLSGGSASLLEYVLEMGDIGIVRTLVEFGADPNQLDDGNYPVFGRAIVAGRVDALEALMAGKRKPNLLFSDATGITATAWARCHGHEDVAVWLERRGVVETGRDICRAQLEELAAERRKAKTSRR